MVPIGHMVTTDTFPVAYQGILENGQGQMGLLLSKASDCSLDI